MDTGFAGRVWGPAYSAAIACKRKLSVSDLSIRKTAKSERSSISSQAASLGDMAVPGIANPLLVPQQPHIRDFSGRARTATVARHQSNGPFIRCESRQQLYTSGAKLGSPSFPFVTSGGGSRAQARQEECTEVASQRTNEWDRRGSPEGGAEGLA